MHATIPKTLKNECPQPNSSCAPTNGRACRSVDRSVASGTVSCVVTLDRGPSSPSRGSGLVVRMHARMRTRCECDRADASLVRPRVGGRWRRCDASARRTRDVERCARFTSGEGRRWRSRRARASRDWGRGRRGRAAAVMMMMTETVTTTRGAMDERCAMGSDA